MPWADLEERRQAEWDKYLDRLPKCSVCDSPIYPGRKLYRVPVGKQEIIFCESCQWHILDCQEIVLEDDL